MGRQDELRELITRERARAIELARASLYYRDRLTAFPHGKCSHCGRDALVAPMVNNESWARICRALHIEGDPANLVLCRECAAKGNGGPIRLDQLTMVRFNDLFFLSVQDLPVKGTEDEVETAKFFLDVMVRRIGRAQLMAENKRCQK